MGQIVSLAAKPKRCNISKLSQLGTPTAGDYILVSSDNSMNAAGQGNFDCYIIGDGTTAAEALPISKIIDLYEEANKDSLEYYTATTGGFYNNGTFRSSTSYKVTDTISLNAGDVLTIETAGRGYDVLTKVDGSTYTRLITVSSGNDSTLQTFTYTAQEAIDVIVTTKNSPTPSIVVNKGKTFTAKDLSYTTSQDANITSVKDALDKLLPMLGGEISIVADDPAFYLNGVRRSSTTYSSTGRIKMAKGETLIVVTSGDGFDVLTNATTEGSYTTIKNVPQGTTGHNTYTYIAPSEMYVIVTTKNSPTPSITLKLTGITASAVSYNPANSRFNSDNVQGALNEVSQAIFGNTTFVTEYTAGFYINGTLHSGSSIYGYSGKIPLSKGDKIVVTTAGSGFDVLTDATIEGSYATLVPVPQGSSSMDTTLATYSFVADRDMDVIVTTKNSPAPTCYYTEGEIEDIGKLVEKSTQFSALTPTWQRNKFIKGVHLDCGRKYFSPANIKLIIDYMAAAGCNLLELHFSEDEGFRFALDDMNVEANGTTYDLSVCLGEGVNRLGNGDGSGKYLTQSEMTDIITYGKSHGIEIAPSFDMPGHMGCILKDFPQFKYDTYSVNFKTEEAINFAMAIADKYAAYFAEQGCHIYNICADEVSSFLTMQQNGDIEYFANFVNGIIAIVSSYGMIPQVFSDGICYNGKEWPIINRSVDVLYYYNGTTSNPFGSVEDIMQNGYEFMVNSSNTIYYVLGKSSVTVQTMLNFNPFTFRGGSVVRNPHGTMFCVWCDNGNTDGQDDGDALTARLQSLIEAYGQTLTSHMVDSNRPVSPSVGDFFFDTKLKKPIWWDGSVWIDAEGNNA